MVGRTCIIPRCKNNSNKIKIGFFKLSTEKHKTLKLNRLSSARRKAWLNFSNLEVYPKQRSFAENTLF